MRFLSKTFHRQLFRRVSSIVKAMKSTATELVLAGIVQLTFMTFYADSAIFVSDVKMNKMIELNARRPHCRLHTDRGYIQSTVLNTDPLKIRQVPEETVRTLENVCMEGNQLTGEIQGKLFVFIPVSFLFLHESSALLVCLKLGFKFAMKSFFTVKINKKLTKAFMFRWAEFRKLYRF